MYNGVENRPSYEELRLSTAFENATDDPQLELKVAVYNINPGKNDDFLEKCQVLSDYTTFIEKIREYEKKGINESIDAAIEWCIQRGILEDFLRKRKSEVIKAMDIDMTFERREELIRRDERVEGRAEGRAEGYIDGQLSAKQSDILELLEDLGSIPRELEDEIRSIKDNGRLKELHKLAARATSVDAFLQAL